MFGADLREDYGRLDQPGALAVPRMLTSVSLVEGATKIWGWAPLDDHGCSAEFDAPVGAELEVETYFWSYFAETNVSVVSLSCPDNINELRCRSGSAFRQTSVPLDGGTIWVEMIGSRQAYVHFAAASAESRVPTTHNANFYTRTGIEIKTISNRVAGGRPTANIGGPSFSSKFTVAHEYGHLKTTIIDIPSFSNAATDYCFGAPNDCTLTWAAESTEWQSAAAIEGFADFFTMLVWNDVSAPPRDGVKAWWAPGDSWRCRYQPDPGDPGEPVLPDGCIPEGYNLTTVADSWHYQANCDPDECPSGVATASDWAFALWDMRVLTSVPPVTLLHLLGLSYPWQVNGENSAFYDGFVADIAGPGLSGDDLTTWLTVSHTRGIDR
jgi:hypothetical protein